MVEHLQPAQRPLESYRNYLCLLARIQIATLDPVLRVRLEVSDLVQETLLKAHMAADQLRSSDEHVKLPWLRRILSNTLIDSLRKLSGGRRNVDLERSLESELEQSSSRLEAFLESQDPSPSEQVDSQDKLHRLSSALGELPEDQRIALELMHLHGLSVLEISERMGKTPTAIGGLLRRGMKKLRELLVPSSDGFE